MRLEAALAFAEADAWVDAAEELVSAWQLAPMTAVAELVVACDTRAPVEGVVAKKVSDREAAWVALAGQRDPDSLKQLLATPWPVHPSGAAIRIELLEKFDPHPRISQALFALHLRRQYPSSVGRRLSRRIFREMLVQRDPIIVEYIARLDADSLADRTYGLATLGSLAKKKLPGIYAPDAREVAAIARLVALTTSPTAATDERSRNDLLAAIYAAPFDDGPREVLADLLVELGDPRGEFIALQLRHARGERTTKTLARERVLHRNAGKSWNEDLEADGAFDVEFARGFPVLARTHHARFGAPAWGTIEVLELVKPGGFTMREVPNLVGVRVLRGIPRGMLAAVVLPRPDQLDELVVDGAIGLAEPTALAPRILGIDALPHAQLPGLAAQIATWPVGRRVVELSVAGYIAALEIVFAILAAAPALVTVSLTGSLYRYTAAAGYHCWNARATRDHLVLEWVGDGYHAAIDIENIAATLRGLTLPVAVIELRGTGKAAARSLPKAGKSVAELAASWPRNPKVVVSVG